MKLPFKGMIFYIFFVLIGDHHAQCVEKSDAFVITMTTESVKVISPQKYDQEITVIIKNNTLSKIYGKLVNFKGDNIKFFSIPSQGFSSYELLLEKNVRAFFVPLSPAFQEFELKLGSKPYEIPPKT